LLTAKTVLLRLESVLLLELACRVPVLLLLPVLLLVIAADLLAELRCDPAEDRFEDLV
jgi:hypothetical protein